MGIEKGIEKGIEISILKGFNKGLSIAMLSNISDFSEEEVTKILKEYGKLK